MRKDAFTLLEVIISMLILVIVTAGSFALIVTTNRQLNTSKHRLQAVSQAQAVLDTLRYYVSADPDNPPCAGGAFVEEKHWLGEPSWGIGITPNIPGIVSHWQYEVNPTDSGCRQVTVSANWSEL